MYITVSNIPVTLNETYTSRRGCPIGAAVPPRYPIIQIVNASVLGRPFTLASNLPIYVKGNYNSTVATGSRRPHRRCLHLAVAGIGSTASTSTVPPAREYRHRWRDPLDVRAGRGNGQHDHLRGDPRRPRRHPVRLGRAGSHAARAATTPAPDRSPTSTAAASRTSPASSRTGAA